MAGLEVLKKDLSSQDGNPNQVTGQHIAMCGHWRVISYNENASRMPPGSLISGEYRQSYAQACRLKKRSTAVADEMQEIYIDFLVDSDVFFVVFEKRLGEKTLQSFFGADNQYFSLYGHPTPPRSTLVRAPRGVGYDYHIQYPTMTPHIYHSEGVDSLRMEHDDNTNGLSIVYTTYGQSHSSPDYKVHTSIEMILEKLSDVRSTPLPSSPLRVDESLNSLAQLTVTSGEEEPVVTKKRAPPRCKGCKRLRKGHKGLVGKDCKNDKE